MATLPNPLSHQVVQWYRGTTALNDAYLGQEGELTVDTDTHTLRLHDNVKLGGWTIGGRKGQTFDQPIALSDLTTAIVTGFCGYWRPTFPGILIAVRLSLKTASSSGIPTLNIKKNGTTVFTVKLTIDATELTSATAAIPFTISSGQEVFSDNDLFEFFFDVAGTGAIGAQLTMTGIYGQ